ncbi:GGDEF domain-containing protein [Glaciimonas sp. PAMC28666]|uniref:GGDEF domain-containing protein n=1 Tax=Glaciimonas sp. PAMC28666 TaxID=2807626 RepID=UPI001964A0C1|nr:GGDEF domain-containing protein [Glaciimonas sp. PAMC28666]QRX84279.1 GGDEF domain-containing protein [Glaciimonas sp. PAMC28666]
MELVQLTRINSITCRMLYWVTLSYALDTLLLSLFARNNVLPMSVTMMYAVMAIVINGGFYFLIRAGYNSRLKDPSMTLAQVLVSTFGQLSFVILAPEVGYLFLINLFTVYAFGVATLSTRRYIVSWLIGAMGLAVVFYLTGARLSLPVGDSRGVMLMYLSFTLTLGRCVFIADYLTRLGRRMSKENSALLLAMERVQELATRDELTNTENRRSLGEILDSEQKRFQRGGESFCIAILDLDGFKTVNDRFGHPVGDEVLKAFVQIVRDQMRLSDHFARYGGDEFVLVLTGTTIAEGLIALERICAMTAIFNWHQFGVGIVVTASIGVTDFRAGETVASAFQRADNALYAAKSAGRNRVVTSNQMQNKGCGIDDVGSIDAAVA